MSPLEELQAAHKRLSELRDRERVVPGPFYLTANASAEQYELVHRWYANVSEKVEMLHRTVDAQISMLNMGIAQQTLLAEQWGDDYTEASVVDLDGIVGLARAINGEA